METINCAVVDDEPLALELLVSYIKKTPNLKLAGQFGNAIDALDAIKNGYRTGNIIDLLFLDIQMPELSGLELGKLIMNEKAKHSEAGYKETKIIFTTAFPQYAKDGYRVDALDYLLKPVSYKEFLESISRISEKIEKEKNLSAGPSMPHTLAKPAGQSVIFVKSEYKQLQIKVRDILYIEGLKDYIKIYTSAEHDPILTLMNMKDMEDKLIPNGFMRIHRSFIINLAELKIVEKGRIILSNGKAVPIGDTYKKSITDYMNSK